ncbi:preprotein translocase subunit F [Deferribacter desulfuricans SSM1]|uniref:Protein-export membrane protein SecF n=1 Tax=Deferribacter desulfuricans (strain DSM 14783 / JCM 11476 / NBRC 101012 / SSM1) TaxID=639282 RepID=D3PAI4_DEFDS|nr:protein translocase subunit SecF [Deferribacter desulfuricans]BAI79607.1 preprotein translocase subunit F [Deferribacter desulfuricans SSM1]
MFEIIKPGTKIDFMGKSKLFFIISGLLVLLSIVIIFTKGFNLGIDFAGGTVIQVRFDSPPKLDLLRENIKKLNLGDVVIQNFGDEREVLIRVEKTNQDLNAVANDIKKALSGSFKGNKFIVERVEQVGPQVGSELQKKATMAVIYALIGILIYVTVRFEFIFSLGAVLALFHDVIITLGAFSLASKEINLPIVAAVLTIVGYSLNDTIVVYDRIRERMRNSTAKINLIDLINQSINETLSRTLLTSFTTFLAVLALYLFGSEVIKNFSFALLVGIIVGTYSSIGIASALVYSIKNIKKA